MDNNNNTNIYVYRCDNYELIKTIVNTHDHYIIGFVEINNRLIVSYFLNEYIKIWSF